MKKIITKAISLVSAIALTASLCAGCGKKGGNAGGDKAKVKDLGGLEITFTAMDKGWFIPAENADNYDEVMALKKMWKNFSTAKSILIITARGTFISRKS